MLPVDFHTCIMQAVGLPDADVDGASGLAALRCTPAACVSGPERRRRRRWTRWPLPPRPSDHLCRHSYSSREKCFKSRSPISHSSPHPPSCQTLFIYSCFQILPLPLFHLLPLKSSSVSIFLPLGLPFHRFWGVVG